MKKIYITLALIFSSITHAEYKINYTLDKQSISFKNEIEWEPAPPTYTNWVNVGTLFNCSKWIPATTTELAGQQLTQKASDCSQNQERQRQEHKKDKNSDTIVNVGDPFTETKVIKSESTRTTTATGYIQVGTGTKTCVSFLQNFGGGYWMYDSTLGTASAFFYGKTSSERSYGASKVETLSVVVDGYILSRGVHYATVKDSHRYGICKQAI